MSLLSRVFLEQDEEQQFVAQAEVVKNRNGEHMVLMLCVLSFTASNCFVPVKDVLVHLFCCPT